MSKLITCPRCLKKVIEVTDFPHTCTPTPLVRELEQKLAEVTKQRDELAAALEKISDGDIGRPHKVEKCSHDKYGFENCEECFCDFARAALASVKESK